MNEDFAIIDMYQQREAIESVLDGLEEHEIVKWLECKGNLTSRYLEPEKKIKIYDFISSSNIHTIFRIENTKVVFLYER